MRLRLTTKLFLAVLATAALALGGMSVAAHWSLTRGFLGYVNEEAVLRMDVALPRIAAAYKEHGSWEFLRRNPRLWFALLRPEPPRSFFGEGPSDGPRGGPHGDHAREMGPPPPDGLHGGWRHENRPGGPPRGFGPDGPHGGPPGPPFGETAVAELTGASLRWSLLDEQRQWITGLPVQKADAIERPVVVDGRTVGYVAMAPFQSVAATGARRFEQTQLKATALVAALALSLAALIAWWVSRSLMKPMRRVAAATSRLAAGDYATRVHVRSQDEVGALAADFNHLAQTLQTNADVRRSFFADVSHELRTPLAILRGELEAIEDGVRPLTPAAVKSLQAEVQGLVQLVEDLNQLALAGTGSLSYRMRPTDLTELLADTTEGLSRRFAEHGLALDVQLPREPVWIEADAARLRQVLVNLLENSLRYTAAGGRAQLRLSADREHATIVLEDSAPGVPEADLPLLFDRFHRAGMPGAKPKGTGLGLAICRAIVQAHRGTITAAPSAFGGLAVTLQLPIGA